ncbi:molecular chaperone GrpE [Thermomonospora echinospora]|uniref:Protein GrpE n=1 Tax=Thermomonospora echinospora TaxID=1992 RepID=A0A1H6D0B0_9ACTN|nr:nucleotide exchange factor GrpE [Thermomonospora echinospora]SEG78255.1 molecular chaperone GrpE [Thermomonospora echinospora]
MSSTPSSPHPTDPQPTEAQPAEARGGRPSPQEEIERLQARVAELEELRRRALADLDNLRKRVARDLGAERERERARIAARWLPILDDLERALEHAAANPQDIIEGVRTVRDRAVAMLADLGYPRRDDLGVPFDPARHEAVGVRTDTDAPAGTIVEVHQPGYGDAEHQLRPAMVSVAAKAED